ncbi:hypothetical protein BpHYR1_051571 [Brachionus plicatilis]|uniref:Uncharacterized protein n=1 Tax=Brachionus plicatilis TaxID=10195 RepID=A0A3M7PBM3_BRAPC|nr:hypothetical protein BpHYR1_051571 [Brachionus plicatilis]
MIIQSDKNFDSMNDCFLFYLGYVYSKKQLIFSVFSNDHLKTNSKSKSIIIERRRFDIKF